MHPSVFFNTAQVMYQPNFPLSGQVSIDQNIANQLVSQYCNLNSMVIPAQYIQSNYFVPSMSTQNQQLQIQQLQQLQQQQQQQQQQQIWIQNGLYMNQYPQISLPILTAQKSDNDEFGENKEDDSFTIRQRGKQTCDSVSTMILNQKADNINSLESSNIDISKMSTSMMFNQQNQNNQFLIQNSSPMLAQYQLQQAQSVQQSAWNPFLQRESEVVGKSQQQISNLAISQAKDNSKQLKIIYTDQFRDSNNSNHINTPTTSTSYKLICNPPSISTSLSTTLSTNESVHKLPKVKKEIILDTEDEDSEMNIEQNLLSSECQQEFTLTSAQLNKELDDAFKSMQSTPFYQNSELIFTPQYGKQFKLKQSLCKNDDIVFSKIKEYRKNRRHQNNGNEAESANPCKINSKFHNLNKLFMYKLLATFSQKNLIELDVPAYLHGILLKLIMRLKQSTKEMKNYNKKTEFFSHDHYNLLFLHLTERTLKYLVHSPFSIYLHKLCFNLDLNQVDQNNCSEFIKLNNEKIQYINIIKRFCCQIVQNSNMLGVYQDSNFSQDESNKNSQNNEDSDFEATPNNESSESGVKSGNKSPKSASKKGEKQLTEQQQCQRQNMRQAYTQRALKGILSLNQGVIIRRF